MVKAADLCARIALTYLRQFVDIIEDVMGERYGLCTGVFIIIACSPLCCALSSVFDLSLC